MEMPYKLPQVEQNEVEKLRTHMDEMQAELDRYAHLTAAADDAVKNYDAKMENVEVWQKKAMKHIRKLEKNVEVHESALEEIEEHFQSLEQINQTLTMRFDQQDATLATILDFIKTSSPASQPAPDQVSTTAKCTIASTRSSKGV